MEESAWTQKNWTTSFVQEHLTLFNPMNCSQTVSIDNWEPQSLALMRTQSLMIPTTNFIYNKSQSARLIKHTITWLFFWNISQFKSCCTPHSSSLQPSCTSLIPEKWAMLLTELPWNQICEVSSLCFSYVWEENNIERFMIFWIAPAYHIQWWWKPDLPIIHKTPAINGLELLWARRKGALESTDPNWFRGMLWYQQIYAQW